jgi:sarcosine oxidase subunit gamma
MTQARYDVAVSRRPMAAIFEAQGTEDGLRAAFAAAGLAVPEGRNRIEAGEGGLRRLRIGPRRILALAAPEDEARLEAALTKAFATTSAADVATVSDMFAILAIDGPDALAVLKQGTPLDLSDTAFPVGAATGTEMWSVGVVLMREADSRYAILIDRALGGYLQDWLMTANGQDSGLRPGTMTNPPPSLKPK